MVCAQSLGGSLGVCTPAPRNWEGPGSLSDVVGISLTGRVHCLLRAVQTASRELTASWL